MRLQLCWQVDLGAPVFSSPIALRTCGMARTAAASADTEAAVVVADVHGCVHALDAARKGKELWQHELCQQAFADGVCVNLQSRRDLEGADTDAVRSEHARAVAADHVTATDGNPAEHDSERRGAGQLLFYGCGQGAVVLLDACTGSERARAQHAYGAASSPPCALRGTRVGAEEGAAAGVSMLQVCNAGAVLIVQVTEGERAAGAIGMSVAVVTQLPCESFSGVASCAQLAGAIVGGRDDHVHAVSLARDFEAYAGTHQLATKW